MAQSLESVLLSPLQRLFGTDPSMCVKPFNILCLSQLVQNGRVNCQSHVGKQDCLSRRKEIRDLVFSASLLRLGSGLGVKKAKAIVLHNSGQRSIHWDKEGSFSSCSFFVLSIDPGPFVRIMCCCIALAYLWRRFAPI